MLWCSDIDGVLVNSRELVRSAYASVGINMPDEAWGHPWLMWLPSMVGSLDEALRIHDEKTAAYVEVIKSGAALENKLPYADIILALEKLYPGQVYYVTGAAQEAAVAILNSLGLNSSALLASSVSAGGRAGIMQRLGKTGVYIDDRIDGQAPAREAGWKFIWARQEWPWTQ